MKLIISLIVCLSAGQTFAQNRISLTEADGFARVSGGATLGTSLNLLTFQVEAGYRLLPKYEKVFLGATFQSSPITRSGTTTTDTFTGYGILGYYHFSDENSGFMAGLKAGLFSRTGTTFNGIFVAPTVVYNYPLFDFLSVGCEISTDILFRTSGSTTVTAPVLINALASVQYWF
ncbi:MAG: hypothetical protein KA715_01125 [Xanthomonadaceae bacterium]|nr:hypothetical protein [Xanthomonadaceae bacterium]